MDREVRKMKIVMVLAAMLIAIDFVTIPACTKAVSTTTTAYQHYVPAYTGPQSDFARYETISNENLESISDIDLTWVVNYCLQQALSDNSNTYLLSWKDQVLIYQNEQIRRAEISVGVKVK